jgi:hypothetical protein
MVPDYGYIFPRSRLLYKIEPKNGLRFILGVFFTSTSGHPGLKPRSKSSWLPNLDPRSLHISIGLECPSNKNHWYLDFQWHHWTVQRQSPEVSQVLPSVVFHAWARPTYTYNGLAQIFLLLYTFLNPWQSSTNYLLYLARYNGSTSTTWLLAGFEPPVSSRQLRIDSW